VVLEVSDVVSELKQFLADPKQGNSWIRGNMLAVYVRKHPGQQLFNGDILTTLDIANVVCDEPGRGIFTMFLNEAERISPYPIFVELIHNRRLRSFLLHRGYIIITGYHGPAARHDTPSYHAFRPLPGHKYWHELSFYFH
jgi:hypothetical protein